ncbi:MAG: hypothetical protein M3Q71_03180 [Chloroflexota bacterium]|nr:hypothetical protein [Chloroflexota bacterium]MDP9469655.1 hypothetical protein [Chloroflexota bacterium]
MAAHLLTTLGRMAALVPAERRESLAQQARLVLQAAREQISIPGDLDRVEQAGAWAENWRATEMS